MTKQWYLCDIQTFFILDISWCFVIWQKPRSLLITGHYLWVLCFKLSQSDVYMIKKMIEVLIRFIYLLWLVLLFVGHVGKIFIIFNEFIVQKYISIPWILYSLVSLMKRSSSSVSRMSFEFIINIHTIVTNHTYD